MDRKVFARCGQLCRFYAPIVKHRSHHIFFFLFAQIFSFPSASHNPSLRSKVKHVIKFSLFTLVANDGAVALQLKAFRLIN